MTTILCIDDEAPVRQLIVEALCDQGYETLEADSGRSGLDSILAHNPDLIICDRKMPVMSGYELLEELREKHPRYEKTPFVFLTCLDDPRDRHTVSHPRPTAYFTKPFDLDELAAVVGKFLS